MNGIKIVVDAFFLMLIIWSADSDRRERTIPNPAMVGVCALGFVQIGSMLRLGVPVWPHLTAVPMFGALYLCWTKELLGGGDVKLMTLICLFMGIGRAAIAFEIGLAVLCVVYFTIAKGSKRRKVALAPPLALGCVCVTTWQYIALWL